jgi:hypothetical protein
MDCLPFVITEGHPLGRARSTWSEVAPCRLQRSPDSCREGGVRILVRAGLPLETALTRMAELQDPETSTR